MTTSGCEFPRHLCTLETPSGLDTHIETWKRKTGEIGKFCFWVWQMKIQKRKLWGVLVVLFSYVRIGRWLGQFLQLAQQSLGDEWGMNDENLCLKMCYPSKTTKFIQIPPYITHHFEHVTFPFLLLSRTVREVSFESSFPWKLSWSLTAWQPNRKLPSEEWTKNGFIFQASSKIRGYYIYILELRGRTVYTCLWTTMIPWIRPYFLWGVVGCTLRFPWSWDWLPLIAADLRKQETENGEMLVASVVRVFFGWWWG